MQGIKKRKGCGKKEDNGDSIPISVCTLKNILRRGGGGGREGRWENDKVRTCKINSYNFSFTSINKTLQFNNKHNLFENIFKYFHSFIVGQIWYMRLLMNEFPRHYLNSTFNFSKPSEEI